MKVVMAVVEMKFTPWRRNEDERFREGCSGGAVAPELTVNTKVNTKTLVGPLLLSLNPK